MKKLILDWCTKTVFSFNSKIYKQIDKESMCSPLGLVLFSIIITQPDNIIIKKYTDTSLDIFYIRYVDDTHLLVQNIDPIHKCSNSFNKNRFTNDKFPDGDERFLDIKTDTY